MGAEAAEVTVELVVGSTAAIFDTAEVVMIEVLLATVKLMVEDNTAAMELELLLLGRVYFILKS